MRIPVTKNVVVEFTRKTDEPGFLVSFLINTPRGLAGCGPDAKDISPEIRDSYDVSGPQFEAEARRLFELYKGRILEEGHEIDEDFSSESKFSR